MVHTSVMVPAAEIFVNVLVALVGVVIVAVGVVPPVLVQVPVYPDIAGVAASVTVAPKQMV
jgi:hypothetical protein